MSVMVTMGLTGDESDDDCKRIAFEMFALAHPVEAFDKDPEGFLEFFRKMVNDPTAPMEKVRVVMEWARDAFGGKPEGN